MAIDVSTKKTLEGNEVVLYSKKQAERFEAQTKPDTNKHRTKIIRQFTDGQILLHKFFDVDGQWMGYALLIGKRGGEQAIHAYGVVVEQNGDLALIIH